MTVTDLSTDLRAFATEVERFLSGRLSRREVGPASNGDHSALLEVHGLERRPERDAADAVTAASRWQAERFDAGLGWITGPARYGGRGLAAEFERLYWEREALYHAPDLTPLNVGTKMLSAAILGHGSEFVRQVMLPALHRGDLIGCQLFSEPDAGSDLSAVRSSATRRDGVWELVGEKVWTSKAEFGDVGLCIARTEAAQDPHVGLTMFLVDMHGPGVEVRPLRQMNGHASFNHVVLNRARVPDSYRLGEAGDGWSVVRTTLMSERAGVGQGAKDPAAHALRRLRALVSRGDLGLGDNASVRQGIADLYSRVRITDFASQRAQSAPGPAGSLNKLIRSRNLQRASPWPEPCWGREWLRMRGLITSGRISSSASRGSAWAEGRMRCNSMCWLSVLGLPRDPR